MNMQLRQYFARAKPIRQNKMLLSRRGLNFRTRFLPQHDLFQNSGIYQHYDLKAEHRTTRKRIRSIPETTLNSKEPIDLMILL